VNVDGNESRIIGGIATSVDLTMSYLRTSHPCYLQFLRNMGVVSILTVAIIVGDTFWGFYSFHSYKAFIKPTVEQLIILETISSVSSMRIDFLLREEIDQRKLSLLSLLAKFEVGKSLHTYCESFCSYILHTLDIDGFFTSRTDSYDSIMPYGDVSIIPTPEGFATLLKDCKINSQVAKSDFEGGLLGLGAGIVFCRGQHGVMGFIRKTQIADIAWAGKPDKVVDTNLKLHPRNSFERYIEYAKPFSKTFSDVDCRCCQLFFDRIVQYMHAELLETFKLSLDQSNAECVHALETTEENNEFFAHMSHELRTPFHGVLSSLQILQNPASKLTDEEKQEMICCALESGQSMLSTLNNILTIAKRRNSFSNIYI
jgi:chemotaxis family two-component system sensor kinase Cph1